MQNVIQNTGPAEENAQTKKVTKEMFASTKQIEKIEVDMAALELSDDSEQDEASDKKNSTMSRLQQESESFLASLHSTPDLSSTLKTSKVIQKSSKDSSSK